MGYIGETTFTSNELNTDTFQYNTEEDLSDVVEILDKSDDFSTDTISESVDNSKSNTILYQLPDLNTVIEPTVSTCTCYSGLKAKMGVASVTTYVYKGIKWYNTTTKVTTKYDYVISSLQVAPTSNYYVDNFTGRIGGNDSGYSKILDATYLDDNESTQSYSLSAGGTTSSSGIKYTFNKSITNTYTASSMDIIESFSHEFDDTYPYCDWIVNPAYDTKGQSRKIEPGIITKATGTYTLIKSSIRDIKFGSILIWSKSGEVVSQSIFFK